jgi:hypothetical protein
VILRRSRFGDVIRRQLDLFAHERAGDIQETQDRLDAYNAADRDDAEELYGDYVDAVDLVKDLLEEVRDTYAQRLDEETREVYEREFERMLAKRWPRFAL